MSVVRTRTRVVLVILATVAALLLVGGAQADAALTITVDTLSGKAADGDCSLEEAIEAANTDDAVDGCAAGSGYDTIIFARPGTVNVPDGGFQVTSNVTIQGHSGGTTISGGGVEVVLTKVGAAGAADTAGATWVWLADLTITGATGAGVTVRDDSDTVSLTDRYNVTLENLLVKGNAAEGVKFVKRFESARYGFVQVKDSVIEGNRKGGVSMKACDGSDRVSMWVVNSSVRNNSSPAGESDWSGGVTNLCGRLLIKNSTVSGNTGARAAVWAEFGGWEDPADKSSSRKATTTTVIINSTIADNKLPRPKRSDNDGGGIHVSGRSGFEPYLEVEHVTITRNEGDRDTGVGIHVDPGVRAGVYNTAIVGNKTILPSGDRGPGTQCVFNGTGRRSTFYPGSARRWSIFHNASSSAACRGGYGGSSLTAEATLGPLADNGGAVRIGPNGAGGHIETIAIDADSRLFGTATSARCYYRDARDVSRWQGRSCDIGAYAASVIEVDTLSGKADDGYCSLGEAIENANEDRAVNDDCRAGFGHDNIVFDRPGTVSAPAGGFEIASNMTIQGHSGGTTISGGGGVEVVLTKVGAAGAADTAGATRVRLADLAITGATGAGVTVTDDSDTAALTDRYDVTLENLLVKGNAAEGVKFEKKLESARPGAVSVKDSIVDGNAAGVHMVACGSTPGDVSLTVTNSIIRRNSSNGVYSSCGRLRVVDSAVSANEGSRAAGVHAHYSGRRADAGTGNEADVEIVNTTVAGNEAVLFGGGVVVSKSGTATPRLSIKNSTIADNTSPLGGGVRTTSGVGSSVVNSVIAGNSGAQCSFGSAPTTNTANASSDESCDFILENVAAGLEELGDNGGAAVVGPDGGSQNVLTMAIEGASPLLGAGDVATCRDKDARGVARPQGSKCDIGAYEADEQLVGDLVWEDRDGDGAQGDGEPGIGGVTLALVNSDDEVEATATTDSDGGYSFKVTAGEWTVRVTDTAGVLAGHPVPAAMSKTAVVSVGGADNLAFDFGYRWITIGDLVWEDRDGDGAQGDGEPGIENVTLALVNSDDEVEATATTDSDGGYSFKVLAGEWTVRVTDTAGVLTGHQPPAETSKTEDVSAGSAANLGFDFGYAPLHTIGDLIWHDANGDGVQDAGEPGIEDVTVELVDTSGNVEGTDETGSDGEYSFEELSGEWTVRVDAADPDLAGYRATTPTSLTLTVSASGALASNFDFGYESSARARDPVINVNTRDDAARDGRCSLVEALEAADTDTVVDGCLAMSGDDTVNISVPGVIRAPDGGFQVASDVTVQGNGGGTTISGGGGVDVVVTERASPATAAASAVTLADLTVTGASGPGVDVVDHAGTALTAAYSVTLENLNIGNSTGRGVSVTRPSGSARPGRVHVNDSIVDGNAAGVRVVACDPSPGDVSLTVTNSIIRRNRSNGVYSSCGRLKVVDSAISANTGPIATGIHAHYSGLRASAGGTATADVEIANTTITGNEGQLLGGGVVVSKSGAATPRLSIANSTITENTSLVGGGVRTTSGVGSSVVNSVVAANSGAQCSFGSTPTDNTANASSDDSCGSGLVEDDFGLGDLDDNGGAAVVGPAGSSERVLTMAIDASSPLFGAGDNTECQATDARGTARPQGTKCDIGAYEADEVVAIGDHVWEDVDNDGVQGTGEKLFPGVTLELVDADDDVVDTATTNRQGAYSFDVTPGEWTVRVTDTGDVLAGHEAIAGESVTKRVDAGGAGALDFDFGYAPLISVGDLVWEDTDGDRVMGDGENPIEGVTVVADDGDGDVRTATTDDDGEYAIRVTPGIWTVRVTDTAGVLARYRASTAESVELDVRVGGTGLLGFDFGYRRLATIGDLVWDDTDGDGVQDSGEPGIEGVTLNLVGSDGDAIATATTGRDGEYSFDELPGEWTVTVTDTAGVLSGRQPTTAPSLTLPVTVEGAAASSFDFGYSANAEDGVINVNTDDGKGRDGRCSLAEALEAAETDQMVDGCLAGSGDDEIKIRIPGVIDAPAAGFKVASNVTVRGKDGTGSTVRGGGGFQVVLTDEESPDTAAATAVTLADLTVTAAGGSGVAIMDHGSDALTEGYEVKLTGLRVHRSTRVRGVEGRGVSFVKAFDSGRVGTVAVEDSVVEHNPGAGVYVDACDTADNEALGLTVEGSVIRNNRSGGVVNACGRLKIEDSAVSDNTAVLGAGVHAHAGQWRAGRSGPAASTDTVIINTTIADNTATTLGGGVLVLGSASFSPSLSILNSTIADNTSLLNGGVQTVGSVDVSVVNSVVAGNSGGQCGFGPTATVTRKANASSDDSCGFGLVRDDFGLGGLTDNGGASAVGPGTGTEHVPTKAIGMSSPLFGAADTGDCPEKDARGVARPAGFGCDIGAYELAAAGIGDLVWEDTDGDGDKGDAEPGIEGVTLSLVDAAGVERATDTTDRDGAYSFDVTPGEWTVRVTDTGSVLTGHRAVSDESITDTVASDDLLGFDFGYAPLVEIGDQVWEDTDDNGAKGDTEPGIAGVTVELTGGDGDPQTKTTNSDGEYSFDVTPGEWTVTVVNTDVLDGYGASTDTSVTADVAVGGANLLDFDFGYQRLVTIGDLVWDDADGDGVQDDTEPGIEGVTVELTGGDGDPQTKTTNSDGEYSFDVAPGEWTITVTDTAGVVSARRPTTPASLALPVALGGASVSNFDFGYTATTGDHVINVNTLDGRSVPDKDEDRRAARDGRCSLAEALRAAETDQAFDGCLAGSGDDTINISVPGEIRASDDLEVESNATVNGNAGGTTVKGGGGFKVTVRDASVTAVTLADLTVEAARGPGVEVEDRAGTAVTTQYTVTLSRLLVKGSDREGVKFDATASTRKGTVRIESSDLEGNDSEGVYMDACAPPSKMKLEILNSTVIENYGGGVRNKCGHLKVVNSLIGENAGKSGGVLAEGGRTNSAGDEAETVTEIVNTTIAENYSTLRGGGVTVDGSDDDTPTPRLTIEGSTIRRNGPRGGAHMRGSAVVSITNTVVAENTGDQCRAGTQKLKDSSDVTLSKSGNASSDDSCGFGLEDIDPGLKWAADSGGAQVGPNSHRGGGTGHVLTMAIDATSPLFNAVDAASCAGKTDARGTARPQGPKCDIGAYEAEIVTITGNVWRDDNGDGMPSSGEPVIVGEEIRAVDANGALGGAGSTDSQGDYTIHVTPGTWTVRPTDPTRFAGHGAHAPAEITRELTAGVDYGTAFNMPCTPQ